MNVRLMRLPLLRQEKIAKLRTTETGTGNRKVCCGKSYSQQDVLGPVESQLT